MAPIVTTSSRKRQRSRFSSFTLRFSLMIAVILVLSAVAIHLFRKGHVPTPPPSSVLPATTAKSTSSPSNKDFPLPTTSVETESAATATAEPVWQQDNPSPVPDGNSPTGQVDNTQTGGEAEPASPPPSGFSHGIESLIGMAFSAEDDSAIPPLPIQEDDASLNDQLRAALTNDIVVYDSDNPSMVAFKERVADVKLQLKEVLDSGGNVAKALLDYQREVNEGAEIRNEVVLKHRELKANASEDEARQFLDAANEALEAEGISPIREDTTPRHKDGN